MKTVIFDIDNTLYDFDRANRFGMEAARDYCRRSFGLEEPHFREYYRIMLLELPVMVVNSSYTGKIRQVAETYIKKIGQVGKEGKIREKAEIITPRFCNSFLFSGLTGLRFLQKRVRFPL